jgi:hypothetical protein
MANLPDIKDDPDPERKALRQFKKASALSWQLIGNAVGIKQDTLRKFAMGDTSSPRKELRDQLRKFLSSDAQGLAARISSAPSATDRLIAFLSSGNHSRPRNVDATGLFFAYHGSYLMPGRFAVRVIEINVDDRALSVTDKISEPYSGQTETHIAYGSAAFVGDPPHLHIVTNAEDNENRLGLGLFVSSLPVITGGKLMEAVGTTLGMTREGHYFSRHTILVRNPLVSESVETMRDQMIGETGVFQSSELSERHLAVIERLRIRLKVPIWQQRFADPIVGPAPRASKSKSGNPSGRKSATPRKVRRNRKRK